jgi:ABC-type amino acid transport substrate-binding protein
MLWTATGAQAADRSVYDHVVQTQTLRCGYNYYEPVIWRDNKTGDLKGIYVDYMKALGEATGLKIEWSQEVGWGDVPVALQTHKIDAFCAGTWADARRGVHIAFTTPVFYNAIETYARPDDHRFDANFDAINNLAVTISTVEGSIAADIAAKDFPRAKILTLPALQSDADMLLNVADKKADVAFTSQGPAGGFMKNNHGKLRRVAPGRPLRVFGVTTAVDIHEQELLSVLNTATEQLRNSGAIDHILAQYEKDYPNAFAKSTKPYELAK